MLVDAISLSIYSNMWVLHSKCSYLLCRKVLYCVSILSEELYTLFRTAITEFGFFLEYNFHLELPFFN